MQAIKIVHFADVHLGMENYGKIDPETGLNSRLADFLKSFDTIVDFVLKNKVDLVTFAGDAYKTREPSPTYQREFAKRIYQIASAGIPVVMVVGNHDFPNAIGKADTLEIFPTLSTPNVTVYQKIDFKIIKTPSGPVQVIGLPWLVKSQVLEKNDILRLSQEETFKKAAHNISKEIELLISKIDKKLPAILIGHASVEGSVYGSERQVMLGSEIVLPLRIFKSKVLQFVGLGHLHKHQIISKEPPIVYSGSIDRIDFGEEKEEKGFIFSEIKRKNNKFDGKISFIKIPTRTFITLKISISENTKDPTLLIIKEIKNRQIKDSIVRLIIKTPEDRALEINEVPIREALKDSFFIAGIIRETQSFDRIQKAEIFSDELSSLEPVGMLEKYLKNKNVPKKRIEILKKETQKLLEESI